MHEFGVVRSFINARLSIGVRLMFKLSIVVIICGFILVTASNNIEDGFIASDEPEVVVVEGGIIHLLNVEVRNGR